MELIPGVNNVFDYIYQPLRGGVLACWLCVFILEP